MEILTPLVCQNDHPQIQLTDFEGGEIVSSKYLLPTCDCPKSDFGEGYIVIGADHLNGTTFQIAEWVYSSSGASFRTDVKFEGSLVDCLKQNPPSSNSFVLLKDGQPIYFAHEGEWTI